MKLDVQPFFLMDYNHKIFSFRHFFIFIIINTMPEKTNYFNVVGNISGFAALILVIILFIVVYTGAFPPSGSGGGGNTPTPIPIDDTEVIIGTWSLKDEGDTLAFNKLYPGGETVRAGEIIINP